VTSSRVRYSALVLVVVVLASACGRSVAATPRTTRATVPSEKEVSATAPQAVPLVLETGVPPHAPRIELVAQRGNRQIVQAGVEFTHDWTIGAVTDEFARDYPVPWPRVSGIRPGDVVSLTLDTPIVPDWVVVKAYAKLVTGDLIPEPIPIAQYGCVRLAAPMCTFERTASGLRIAGLDEGLLGGPYLVVFCMWHVPLAMQKAQTSPRYDVAASWLFHIDSPARPKVSQS
jgi:hypothetical protein